MSVSPTSSSPNHNLQNSSVYGEGDVNAELTPSSSASAAYLHHLTGQVDHNNVVSSTQHQQQPYKHMLAQKYAAESTSEPVTSEHQTDLQHSMSHFYEYSPLVSSSCTSTHYETGVLEVGHGHNQVVHVESTGDPLDDDDALMHSQSFHQNIMIEQFVKREQVAVSSAAPMVSSTSAVDVCRTDIMFDCTSEAVDSTTNGQQTMSFVPYDTDNKLAMEEIVTMQSNPHHHLMIPQTTATQYLHQEGEIPEEVNDPCQRDLQSFSRVPVEQSQAHVINDLPVLSRARASLPTTYLLIEDFEDQSNGSCGVFARKTIPKTTQFGPVEGVIIEHNSLHLDQKLNFIIFVTETLILDQSDENQSNWMKFVRPANTYEEQNLVLISKENITSEVMEVKFYFMTTRPINTKEELKVWYSREYAEKFNLRVLEPINQQPSETNEHEINGRKRNSSSSQTIPVTTGGHKLRNKIAKTQQQQLQMQKQQKEFENSKDSNANENKKDDGSAKYQCETCQKVFPRFYSLRRHQIMHSGEKKYKCPICGMSFSHVYNRNRHVKRHSKAKKPPNSAANDSNQENNLKNENKSGNENLKNDLSNLRNNNDTTKSMEKPVILAVAKKSAPPVIKANTSVKTHKPYRCHECYKSFTTDDRLLRHAIVHSSDEDVKPLACQFCQKRFLNNSALSCHLKIHFTPKDQPRRYDCVICKEWFDSTQARKDHVLTHADPISGQYTCPNCLKTFDEFAAVRKHIRAFHSDKQYPCTQCEKVFPRPDKLKLHMLRHSDHREFLCANCGKQFKRKDKLKEHMQRMHAPDREAKIAAKQAAKLAQQQNQQHKKFVPKVSPTDYHRFIYKCHTCLLGFKRRGMLVNHLAKRHPDIPPESVPELNLPILKTTRDYYCQYCDKIYKSSSKRKAHIIKNHPGKSLPLSNRHKGGVPVIPGIPNPTYSETVGSITTHPHYCDWCHKQYASKAKLLQHQRKKHPEQMAIINTNARNRQRSAMVQVSSSSLPAQTSSTNVVSAPAISTSPVTISPGVAATNLITILASSTDLQELLQNNSTNDLLTQAMSELTSANPQCKGDTATLIIAASANDPNWSQVCEEM